MSGFFYVASPYTKHPRGIHAAHVEAVKAAAICIKAGIPVYSPIAHSHLIAAYADIPLEYEHWRDLDEAMIEASNGLIVVEMDGWRESVGINAEIQFAKALGKPVLYMAPEGPAPVVSE
jgi:nucleoside 2-deoxyribosyltransferase